MENTQVATQATTSWFDSFTSNLYDVACFSLYLTVGTGVVAVNAVNEIALPAIKQAAIYTAAEGEKFCKDVVVPAYKDAIQHGEEIRAQWMSPTVAAAPAPAAEFVPVTIK